MITVKCTFANGDNFTTGINLNYEEASRYYLNRYFNLGTENDNMQKCVKVEEV